MAWRIEFEASAAKELKKLDKQNQARILRFLRERVAASEDPRQLGRPLRQDLAGLWKFRVGDCRVIAHIEDERLVILVLRVGHRRYVYGGH